MASVTSTPTSAPATAVQSLTIANAEVVATDWRHRIESGETTFDLGSVERCDALGIQLLISARRTGAALGREVSFRHVPSTVRATASIIGATGLFEPEEETSP